ncbi:MAG: hypothetical protein HC819_22075 [Cyclobacteriaceae bacterium]|nr:hypothetical protein [Cyclobacteriaceae bacterium]
MIYGTKSDDDRFRMLKSRLKQKLLNHMFFLDFTENNQKASSQFEQECIQQLHQAKMLLFTGEYRIAKSLVLKAMTTAERCEFTKYIIYSLEDLVRIYSENCQPHLFEDVVNRLAEVREIYNKEEGAREHFYFIKMMVIKSVNSRKKNLENAAESIVALEKLYKATQSYNIFEYLLQLNLLHKELTGDFQGIITMLKEIEKGKYLGNTLNENRMDYGQLIKSMAFAYLKAWDFDKGIAYVEKLLDYFEEGSSDWYNLRDTYFLLAVFKKKYKLANEIIDKVFENKTFEKLDKEEKEKWKLYNAYLQLVGSGNFFLRNYSFVNILEKMPEYDKEREGFNAAIIILQFIYYVEQGQLNELENAATN